MPEFKKEPENLRHKYADSAEASHIYLLPNSLTAGNLILRFLSYLTLHPGQLRDGSSSSV
jgi:hypothetical protein